MKNQLIYICTLITLLGVSCKNVEQKQQQEKPKNVLFICIDDLRPELNSFGVLYIKSPNIDGLAAQGYLFTNHYVNSPSCGPSRYTMLTGQYGFQYRRHHNQQLFSRVKDLKQNPEIVNLSMPEWFKSHGYITVSVGKVSHHPGGRGGENWDEDSQPEMPDAWSQHIMPVGAWKTPKGTMHGLANGKIRTTKSRDVLETVEGPDTLYPDGLIADEGMKQLEALASGEKPFFLAIGLIKPHLPFGVPKKYLDMYSDVEIAPIPHPEKPKGPSSWTGSNEFMSYNRWGKDPRKDMDFAMKLKKYYAACVTYADKHVGDILNTLKKTGADKNTIVVLWGDHGWHLGEHAIWGKHCLFEEALRSPLIIYNPDMNYNGKKSNTVVETVDIFPTLCDLTQLPIPDFSDGASLVPIMENQNLKSSKAAIAYTSGGTTIRTDKYRFTKNEKGFVELYNHQNDGSETVNIADKYPEIVKQLEKQIIERVGEKAFDWDL
ncbi:sulfatase [Seonamhaeicola sp. NFXS20]|uniref:sulfatase n=1 Tax=Seonamhaeicola sp. NFXS20 TaxID=2816959 RepID=UPI003B8B367F